jgi:DNA-binding IclR family transcriptional regulator
MTHRPLTQKMQRLLRLVPHQGDSIRPHDIAQRLGLRLDGVHQMLQRAVKRGLVVRLRAGDYCLPGVAP